MTEKGLVMPRRTLPSRLAAAAVVVFLLAVAAFGLPGFARTRPAAAEASNAGAVSLGPQYVAQHVYLAPDQIVPFTRSFVATFGGSATDVQEISITPTPSRNLWSLVTAPNALLSVFGFTTPVPYPFGAERTGYGVSDVGGAVRAARRSGAFALIEPFQDAVGPQAVMQFPGGVNTQIYYGVNFPFPPRAAYADNRIYLPADTVDAFLRSYLRFSGAHVVRDDRHADGGRIGKPGTTYRSVYLDSAFGPTVVIGSDNHLPYPFGREVLGLPVDDLPATLTAATTHGATVLWGPYRGGGRVSAILKFPGDALFEVHEVVGR